MTDFSFLHAADLHLDSPLRGLDPEAPVERIRRATRDALVNMVDFALRAAGVEFVLLAGDLYDGDWKDWRTGQFLVQQLGRLLRDGIEVVAISGNHDAAKVLSLRVPVPGLMGTDKPGDPPVGARAGCGAWAGVRAGGDHGQPGSALPGPGGRPVQHRPAAHRLRLQRPC